MSVQHQTVHIFQVDSEGYFGEIERKCYDNDDYLLSHILSPTSQTRLPGSGVYRAYKEITINLLKTARVEL